MKKIRLVKSKYADHPLLFFRLEDFVITTHGCHRLSVITQLADLQVQHVARLDTLSCDITALQTGTMGSTLPGTWG